MGTQYIHYSGTVFQNVLLQDKYCNTWQTNMTWATLQGVQTIASYFITLMEESTVLYWCGLTSTVLTTTLSNVAMTHLDQLS